MQSLRRFLFQPNLWAARRTCQSSGLPRYFATGDDRGGSSSQPPGENGDGSDDLFSDENTEGISPVEISRMRMTYGLLKEHIDALEQNLDGVDPETNPLLDPRSFDTRKIPKLPKEVLAQFRRELPAPAADSSRPVPTYGIWDALSGGGGGGAEGSAPSEELESAHAAEWAVVDERTMDGRQFSRMQRQSLRGGGGGEASFRAEAGVMGMQRGKGRGRRKCPLQDERGRVKVDFRAVGSLTPYLSEGGKILGKRRSGLSAKSQRKVARAIKTARTMGLIAREPRVGLTYEELMELEKSL